MDEHPFSKLQESNGAAFPSPATLEERGRTCRKASDDYLVGFVMESWGTDAANQTSAVVEMQRRLMVEIKRFNQSSTCMKVTSQMRSPTCVTPTFWPANTW